MATLTFVYADSTAVIGPLAPTATPGGYDLCAAHARYLSVPRGWEAIRLDEPTPLDTEVDEDGLMALANAIREIGMAEDYQAENLTNPSVVELGRRGHLRVIADASRDLQ